MFTGAPVQRTTQPWLIVVGAVVAVGLGVLIGNPPTLEGSQAVLAGIVLFASTCLLPLILRLTQPVSPGFLYAIASFATLGIGAFAWLGYPFRAAAGLNQEAIANALVVASIGMVAFWAGYLMLRPPRDVRPGPVGVYMPLGVLYGLFGLGLAADGVLFRAGRFAYLAPVSTEVSWWETWLITAGTLTAIATVVAAIHAFGRGSRRSLVAMVVMLVISAGVGAAAGFKGQVLLPFELVLFVFYYYRRTLPKKLLALGAIAFLVLVPANLSYRGALNQGSPLQATSVDPVLGTLGRTFQSSLSMPLDDRLDLIGAWASLRVRDIDSLARIEQLTPSRYPYLGMWSYTQIPAIALVPRVLWDEKPVLNNGVEFGQQYFFNPQTYETAVAVTHMGDLYMHAGLMGVVAGMAVWGALLALGFRWLRRHESPGALLVFVVAMATVLQTESDFTNLIAGAYRNVLLAWICARLLYGRMPVYGSGTTHSA